MNVSSLIIFAADGKAEVKIQRENDVLKCPFCDKTYHAVDSLKNISMSAILAGAMQVSIQEQRDKKRSTSACQM